MSRGGTGLLAGALAALLLLPLPARSEVAQKQGVRVAVDARLAPKRLPRAGAAPVAISFAGRIGSTSAAGPPQLAKIAVALNSHGHLHTAGLPRCRLSQIRPSTDAEALAACRSSLIGEGSFAADVKIPEQSPFPSSGKILAFNGAYDGHPAILAHIYGTAPIPTSYVLPFQIARSHGTYGTLLEASLPRVLGDWGFVKGLSLRLDRSFYARGKRQSYLSAGCPAPPGFSAATFPLAKTSFSFLGGLRISSVLSRGCRVGG